MVTALYYNTWFTALDLSNAKPAPEVMDTLAVLCQRTTNLQELRLRGTVADSKHWHKLVVCIGLNPHQSIRALDLSHTA